MIELDIMCSVYNILYLYIVAIRTVAMQYQMSKAWKVPKWVGHCRMFWECELNCLAIQIFRILDLYGFSMYWYVIHRYTLVHTCYSDIICSNIVLPPPLHLPDLISLAVPRIVEYQDAKALGRHGGWGKSTRVCFKTQRFDNSARQKGQGHKESRSLFKLAYYASRDIGKSKQIDVSCMLFIFLTELMSIAFSGESNSNLFSSPDSAASFLGLSWCTRQDGHFLANQTEMAEVATPGFTRFTGDHRRREIQDSAMHRSSLLWSFPNETPLSNVLLMFGIFMIEYCWEQRYVSTERWQA